MLSVLENLQCHMPWRIQSFFSHCMCPRPSYNAANTKHNRKHESVRCNKKIAIKLRKPYRRRKLPLRAPRTNLFCAHFCEEFLVNQFSIQLSSKILFINVSRMERSKKNTFNYSLQHFATLNQSWFVVIDGFAKKKEVKNKNSRTKM